MVGASVDRANRARRFRRLLGEMGDWNTAVRAFRAEMREEERARAKPDMSLVSKHGKRYDEVRYDGERT